uniref:Queuosine 5'-phosphate N-glycosylase/hydrolase n=1 Tax=Trypanosoma congolense (strain IL3000) TaxID=1068625 RepID=G0UWI4_TRYCI|nr:conserved hypothetical protein [Trypanosoma congolense IL3000]
MLPSFFFEKKGKKILTLDFHVLLSNYFFSALFSVFFLSSPSHPAMVKSVKTSIRELMGCDVAIGSLCDVRVMDIERCSKKAQFETLLREYADYFYPKLKNGRNISTSAWLAAVPVSLRVSVEDVVNYLGMLVAIDFRHWGEDTSDVAAVGSRVEGFCGFYAAVPAEGIDEDMPAGSSGRRLIRGSMAMVHLLRRAVEKEDLRWYCPIFLQQFRTTEEALEALKCCFVGCKEDGCTPMQMPATRERVELLMSLSRSLLERDTSYYKMLCTCEGYLYGDVPSRLGFIEMLVELHPRYHDVCVLGSREKESERADGDNCIVVPALKLAQLTAIAVDEAVSAINSNVAGTTGPSDGNISDSVTRLPLFKDRCHLTVCCDYQLPKALRSLGLMEYSPRLASLVDGGVLLTPGGAEECSIRVGALVASERLLDYLNSPHFITTSSASDAEGGRRIWDAAMVDSMLWWIGRHYVGESVRHHLCRTIMY